MVSSIGHWVIREGGQTLHPVYALGMICCSYPFSIFASRSDLRHAAELRSDLYAKFSKVERRIGNTAIANEPDTRLRLILGSRKGRSQVISGFVNLEYKGPIDDLPGEIWPLIAEIDDSTHLAQGAGRSVKRTTDSRSTSRNVTEGYRSHVWITNNGRACEIIRDRFTADNL